MTIVEMRVHMDCPGCESKIKKSLQKLDGVDNVDIDMGTQKVTVTGWADQTKVLKRVRRTGRRAELWPFPYNPEFHDFTHYYYHQHQPEPAAAATAAATITAADTQPYSSYNYRHHGYDGHDHGYYTQPYSSYNYRHHGYDGHDHGYYKEPPFSTVDERASSMFSDENANACSIM